MITPIFKLTQDADHLFVTITAPNIHLAEAELFHEGHEFIFHAKPYYLRLDLPGPVQASECTEPQNGTSSNEEISISALSKVKFNCDTKELLVSVPKLNKGEHFPDLEMIGKFLSGPKTNASRRLLEVLDSTESTPLIDDLLDEEDFDWNIEQKLPSASEETVSGLLGKEPYGFANGHSGTLERLGPELTHDLIDIDQPGKRSPRERRLYRLRQEEGQFSEDHYIADLYDTEQIDQLIAAAAPWHQWNASQPDSIMSNEDRQRMIDHLAKRDFPKFDTTTKKALMLGVVDILYAYAYDLRVNDFEHTSESGWTIRKLSPTLSCFEFWTRFGNIEGDLSSEDMPSYVLLSCIRRSLIYPLYRNWKLSLKVARDVVLILSKGRSAILKCFLDVHRILNETGDNFYLLNDLYITDYCCWLQQIARSDQFDSLARHLDAVTCNPDRITKCDLCLDLELIEKAAELAWNLSQQEEEEISLGLKESLRIVQENSNKVELDSDDEQS